MNCYYCQQIPIWKKENSPFLIHEFKSTYLIAGDHQTFKGYCVLVQKDHIKELVDNKFEIQIEILKDLNLCIQAIKKAFPNEKINLSNYGNMTPHQHWHIFPRNKSDSNWPEPPWTLMSEFSKNKTSDLIASKLKEALQKHL